MLPTFRLGAFALAGSLACALCSPCLAQKDAADVRADTRAKALAELHLRDGIIVQLDIDRTLARPVQVVLPIAGVAHVVDLQPNSIRAPGYRLLAQGRGGVITEEAPGPDNTLWGSLPDVPDSVAAGGMMPDGLYATVRMPDGSRWWVQPLERIVPGVAAGSHILYAADDVIPTNGVCGVADMTVRDPGTPRFIPRGVTTWTAQVGVDADYELYATYGSTILTQNRMALIINTINVQYWRDVDIRHIVTGSLVRTDPATQPYTSLDIDVLLGSVRSEWNNNQGAITHDIAHLFTGKNVTTPGAGGGIIIGYSYVGVVCTTDQYGWSHTNWTNTFAGVTDLTAHEIGHNWSCCHCTCSSPPSTMNPNITSINRFTGTNATCSGSSNVAQIIAHRNSRGCLDTGSGGNAPLNDSCASAASLAPTSGAFSTYAFGNVGADADGPAPSCQSIWNASIWYSYVAPCDGNLRLDTCAENTFDTILTVYTGSCGSLTEVACNDDNGPYCTGNRASLNVAVTRGTFYFIRIAGYSLNSGTGVLTVFSPFCSTPGNDACGSAITIQNGYPLPFTTIGATTDGPAETPCSNAGNTQVAQDIWFRYIAPCTGVVRVSTCGADFDSRIAVYAGGCPGGPNTAISCDDDDGPACTGTRASLDFNAAAGAQYTIRVGGFATNVGSGILSVTSLSCPRPSNDDCANAISVSSGQTILNDILGATPDGDTSCANTGHSIWFDFVSPGSGTLLVTTCGTHDTGGIDTGVDTVVSLHSTCIGTSANELACNDDNTGQCGVSDQGFPRDSYVSTAVTPGQDVKIRVASFGSGDPPNKQIILNVLFIPGNDDCANARTVFNLQSVSNEIYGATQDGSTGCTGTGRDVWFDFTAPTTGVLYASTCGTHDTGGVDTGVDTVLSIHSGCPGTAGNQLACNDDSTGQCGSLDQGSVVRDSYTSATLTSGQNVKIRVASFGAGTPPNKPITLNITFIPANDTCANAVAVGEGVTTWYNAGASTDGPSPAGALCTATPLDDIWLRYTPTCSGTARISTCTTPFDSVLAVYAGSCAALGTPIACDDDNGPGCFTTAASVDVVVNAGQTYLLRLGSFNPSITGQGTLAITCTPAPGACCAGAICSQQLQSACSGPGQKYIGPFAACNPVGNYKMPCCMADFDQNGVLNVSDIFQYLTAWFAHDPRANINGGPLDVNDIFVYLAAWFAKC